MNLSYSSIISSYLSSSHAPGNSKAIRQVLAGHLNLRCLELHGQTLSASVVFYCYVYLDPRHPGDYKYVLPSGKIVKFKFRPFYVGKGKGNRAYAHLGCALRGYRTNKIKAIRKAGLEPLVLVTTKLFTEAIALAGEIDLISGIGRLDIGTGPLTNLTDGGEGLAGVIKSDESLKKQVASRKGYKHSQETKDKIAIKATGRTRSQESKDKQSESTKGVPKSIDHILAVGRSLKGRVFSEQHRQRISEGNKGKTVSAATRRKTSNSLKGVPKPDGFGDKISRARTGMKFSAETCAKISEAHKGKSYGPRSDEARANQSAAIKLWWAKRKLSGL